MFENITWILYRGLPGWKLESISGAKNNSQFSVSSGFSSGVNQKTSKLKNKAEVNQSLRLNTLSKPLVEQTSQISNIFNSYLLRYCTKGNTQIGLISQVCTVLKQRNNPFVNTSIRRKVSVLYWKKKKKNKLFDRYCYNIPRRFLVSVWGTC